MGNSSKLHFYSFAVALKLFFQNYLLAHELYGCIKAPIVGAVLIFVVGIIYLQDILRYV